MSTASPASPVTAAASGWLLMGPGGFNQMERNVAAVGPDLSVGFRAFSRALIRAAAHGAVDVSAWPDLTNPSARDTGQWVGWLRHMWARPEIAEAVEHASPVLAREVRTLLTAQNPAARRAYRAVVSMARYLQRMSGRPTPFGLFAGVAAASFGDQPQVSWGGKNHAVARAAAAWLEQVVAELERSPQLFARLPVVVNNAAITRGGRVIVPYQPRASADGKTAVEVSLRATAAVRMAVELARAPIAVASLADKLRAEFPRARPVTITTMIADLVARGALITSLRASSTEPDALGHLMKQLDATDIDQREPSADLVRRLREIHSALEDHNTAPATQGRAARERVATRMREIADDDRHPVAVDLRLDAAVVLPPQVAREAERAALALARLSAFPYGVPAWRDYHQRFYERYGIGSMVSLLEVVNPDSGIGWPDGYPGTVTPERRLPLSHRDETLLALAQCAALDGRDEVELDEPLLAALDIGPTPPRLPSHLELSVRVDATDLQALSRDEFTLEVLSVSRAAGALTGRFLHVLDQPDRTAMAAVLAGLPGGDDRTAAAQVSFPPLDPATAHVARAPQVLPTVISVAEHCHDTTAALTPRDLAVACDGRRMYLAVPERGHRVEATGMHALNLRRHTPPLARFLTEIGRAQCAQVTMFDWGAASSLPFLPRVRRGRAILAPATWRLNAAELPRQAETWARWEAAWSAWRSRRRVPCRVHLVEADRRLPLDLDETAHLALLREHLNKSPAAELAEAPADEQAGWCGGRPHEVIIPLAAAQPPRWPQLPAPSPARVIGRDHGQTPATSRVLLAKLYGDIARQDLLLAEHLPALLSRWDQPPAWWFLRFRDPDQHLRLRIALADPGEFGPVAGTVSAWADALRQVGLLREVTYATSHPETGRWGSGAAMAAAEAVFGTDSRAVITQLAQRKRPHRQALAAANFAAIAIAFTGSATAGMRWLVDHIPAAAPQRTPRPVFDEAVRICDPRDNWAALRATPGGDAIHDTWRARAQAIAFYRARLNSLTNPEVQGVDCDDVLGSLMHAHFIRAVGIDFDDEAVCHYLARSAAVSWQHRTGQGRP